MKNDWHSINSAMFWITPCECIKSQKPFRFIAFRSHTTFYNCSWQCKSLCQNIVTRTQRYSMAETNFEYLKWHMLCHPNQYMSHIKRGTFQILYFILNYIRTNSIYILYFWYKTCMLQCNSIFLGKYVGKFHVKMFQISGSPK